MNSLNETTLAIHSEFHSQPLAHVNLLDSFHRIIELPLLLLRSEDFTWLNIALELHRANERSKSCAFFRRQRYAVSAERWSVGQKCRL